MIILKKQLYTPAEGNPKKAFSRYKEMYQVNVDGHIFKVRVMANAILASGNGVEALSTDTIRDIRRLIRKANAYKDASTNQ